MTVLRAAAVTMIGPVTGEDSGNRTASRFHVQGTDLGVLWDDGAGGVLVAFGDTYGVGWGAFGAGPRTADWRWNTLGRSTNRELRRGLLLDEMMEDVPGHAAELLPRDPRTRRERTVIPTAGIAVDAVQYVHYMSVRRWGRPGRWRTNHAGLATSTDGGHTWTRDRAARWRNTLLGQHPFQLGGFVRYADRVYLFGTRNGRFGDVYLARVGADAVGEVAAYTYWTGVGWSAKTADAAPVAAGPAGELSVAYHAGFRRWIMLHLDESSPAMVLRSAPAPTGPWSRGQPVVSGSDYPGLYGGYLHPWALDGTDIYFTMSLWGPYAVYLVHAELTQDSAGLTQA